jgi:cell division FtsZ-interacting protein ZapD
MTKKNNEQALIDTIKALLKQSPTVQGMFDAFGVDIEELESIPIEFKKLKVSAKTKNGQVYLNEELLADGDFKSDVHYIVHEANHWLQQTKGDADKYQIDSDLDYLDLPAEIEAFGYQIRFMKEFYGEETAHKYLDDLLDFHDIEGEARDKKSSELMGD